MCNINFYVSGQIFSANSGVPHQELICHIIQKSEVFEYNILLKYAIINGNLPKDYLSDCSSEELRSLLKISKKNDIAHLIAFTIEKNGLIDKSNDCYAWLSRELLTTVYRYEKINHEYNRICDALESAELSFLPLKGSVLRQYYPEPWMRTSCDIDILVHENDLEKATEYLVRNLGYIYDCKGPHDVSLYLQSQLHLELHYTLIADGVAKSSCEVLKNVWQSAFLQKKKEHCYEMTDEMFYFYHIAHMAKHFEEGGCGIRPFIDLWTLDNIKDVDHDKRDELLSQGNLLRFAEVVRMLSRVWFENNEHTEITKKMERYILRGGIYGTNENRIAVQQQKGEGG